MSWWPCLKWSLGLCQTHELISNEAVTSDSGFVSAVVELLHVTIVRSCQRGTSRVGPCPHLGHQRSVKPSSWQAVFEVGYSGTSIVESWAVQDTLWLPWTWLR